MTSIEESASEFVTTALQPAIDRAEDGGHTLMRVLVEKIFHIAAQADADSGTDNVRELLDLAALASAWGTHQSRTIG
jgi:hypothetical protein